MPEEITLEEYEALNQQLAGIAEKHKSIVLDKLSGMSLGDLAKLRARVSVASRPEDKIAALDQVFPGAVEVADGELLVGGRKWDPGNKEERAGRSWGAEFLLDLADAAGPAIEAVPAAVGALKGAAGGAAAGALAGGVGAIPGAIAGAFVGGGIGGAAGNAARQGAEEVLSGGATLDRSTTSRLAEMQSASLREGAMNALGEGSGLALRGAGRYIHGLTPTGQFQRELAKEASGGATAAVREAGQRQTVAQFAKGSDDVAGAIAESSGKPFAFSVGEQTGSPSALALEKTLSERVGSSGAVLGAKADRIQQARSLVDDVISEMGGAEALVPADAGRRLAGAVKGYNAELVKVRREAAAPLFQLAEQSGVKIKTPSTLAVLREIIERSELGVSSSARVAGKDAEVMLGALGATRDEAGRFIQGGIPPKQMQVLLEDVGEALRGGSDLFEGLPTTANKRLAKKLMRGLRMDLSEAAESGVEGAQHLADARQVYARTSQEIEELTLDGIKKLLKLDAAAKPDAIPAAMLKESPSHVAAIMRVLEKADEATGSQAARDLRGSLLQQVLDTTAPADASALGVQGATISPERWLSAWRKNGGVLRAAFANEPGALKSLATFNRAAKRFAASTGVRGSDTFQKQFANRLITLASKIPGAAGAASSAQAASNKLLTDEGLVRLLTEPEAIRHVVQAMDLASRNKLNAAGLDRIGLLLTDALALTGRANLQNDVGQDPRQEAAP